jgi:membrane-anchored protein YejM (alkaline phosphatase superfamily)
MVYRFLFISIAVGSFFLLAQSENDNLLRREKISIVMLTVENLHYDLVNSENYPHLLEASEAGLYFDELRTTPAKAGPDIVSLLTGRTLSGTELPRKELPVGGVATPLPLEQLAQDGYRVEAFQPFMATDFYRHLGLTVASTENSPQLWLAEQRGQQEPFFLWYHHGADLTRHEQTYSRQFSNQSSRQEESYEDFDQWFGKFYSFFSHGGFPRDAILLVTTIAFNNQELAGMNSGPLTSPTEQHQKQAEQGVLFIWLPEKFHDKLSQIRLDKEFSSLDIMPTLLALLDLKPPVPLTGRNLFIPMKEMHKMGMND